MTRALSWGPAVLVAAAALALAGCNQSQTPASARTNAPAAAATVAAHTLPRDHAQTSRYRIDITYPTMLPLTDTALVKALHKAAATAKRHFMQVLPDPKQYPEVADRQMLLKIRFLLVARTPAFVSVREQGMADVGGAHPVPLDRAFVYAAKADKMLALGDLFTDPAAARKKLADLARTALEKKLLSKVPGGSHTTARARKEWTDNMRHMIEQGTQPTAVNYTNFLVLAGADGKASTLELVFPPYHVAPYVYGTQSVKIPVDAFAALLKAGYRDDFGSGK